MTEILGNCMKIYIDISTHYSQLPLAILALLFAFATLQHVF